MRRVIAAALAVTLTVGAADAMSAFNAVKSFILGGRNSGNHTITTPTPAPVITPPAPTPPPVVACANGNLLLDYSDACQLMTKMVGL